MEKSSRDKKMLLTFLKFFLLSAPNRFPSELLTIPRDNSNISSWKFPASIEHFLDKYHQALKFAFHSDHKGQTKSLWDCPSKQKESGF